MTKPRPSPLKRVRAAAARQAEAAGPAPASAASAPSAQPSEAAPPPTSSDPKGKLGLLVGRLRHPDGATLADLVEVSGWQAHSVRGALAGALKKRGFEIASEKAADQPRRYHLPAAADAQAEG